MKRLSLALVACLACASPVDPPQPTGGARTAVIGGTPSDSSQDFVLVIANVTDAQGLECNADLVAPNLLVTARHCVAVLDETKQVSCAVAGGSGSSPTATGDYSATHFVIATDEALTHTLAAHAIRIFDSGASKLCGDDIAFVLLDTSLDSLPIAPISTSLVAAGDTVTVVGSGQIDGSGTPATTRMQRTGVSVLGVGPTAVSHEAVSDGEFATSVAFCNGDSGGPAIDASGRITGLVSRTPSCTSGPDVFTAVAAHLDVAQQAFAAAGVAFPPDADAGADAGGDAAADAGDVGAGSGCAVAARSVQCGSETITLLAMLAFAFARRRRRRDSGVAIGTRSAQRGARRSRRGARSRWHRAC